MGGAVWFTSDTHFGDERAVRKYKRPFRHVLDHDRYLIETWNAQVKPGDVVYHLGDVGDPHVLAQLNGRKIVVVGNHDDPGELYALNIKAVRPWHVVDVLGVPLALTHDPLFPRPPRGVPPLFLFGHLHRLFYVKDGARLGLNVGVESHFFRLVPARDALYWLELLARTPERVTLTRAKEG